MHTGPAQIPRHLIPYSFKVATATSLVAEFSLKTVPAFSLDILCCSVLKT